MKKKKYLDAKEFHDPLVVILVGVDGHKEQVSLVLLGNGLGNLHLSLHATKNIKVSVTRLWNNVTRLWENVTRLWNFFKIRKCPSSLFLRHFGLRLCKFVNYNAEVSNWYLGEPSF